MLRLERLHQVSQLLFFAITLIIPLTFNNPVFSAVSLICAVIYLFITEGKKALKVLTFSFALILIVSLFNMLFAHYGETVLFSVKNVDFTFESLFYGFNQGMMLAGVLIWFTVFGKCIDSERIIYLFRFAPKLALIFSMVLGFIPRFIKKSKDIRDARIGLCGGKSPESFKEKLKFSTDNFSALVSYSLESSIITAQSMEARGYNPRAIRASGFKLAEFDLAFIPCVSAVFVFLIVQYSLGNIKYIFEPAGYMKALSIPALVLFLITELYPLFSELREKLKWKQLSVKA